MSYQRVSKRHLLPYTVPYSTTRTHLQASDDVAFCLQKPKAVLLGVPYVFTDS